MRKLLIWLAFSAAAVHAQSTQPNPQFEGLWEGYDGEWGHVSRQLIALAEAIPADKYSWRPAPGVRSVSEVFVHIAQENLEETVTSKAAVIEDLKRSLDAVKTARAQLKPGDLERKVAIEGKT